MDAASCIRILLVHGDLATHRQLREMLYRDPNEPGQGNNPLDALYGLQVDAVCHPKEGVALLRQTLRANQPYLAAILDVESGGLDAARSLWLEDSRLPILVCTPAGCPLASRREISRQLGNRTPYVLVEKPLDREEICRLVASQIDYRLGQVVLRGMSNQLCATQRELDEIRDQAESAERAKSEFMANIGHEIRTPMNAILGFTQLLMKDPHNENQLDRLQYIQDAGKSLLSLINNMLDYSRLSSGQLGLRPTALNLNEVIEEVLVAVGPCAKEKQLGLQYHVVSSVPAWLRGDRTRIRQILINLVSNAVKFTESGNIQIQATLDEEHADDATVRITVTDTGVGIPPERQAIIFDGFSQADGSATRRYGGLGLGLAICKQLVDLMGGQIGFRSLAGHGSCFWLTLPLKKYQNQTRPAGSDQVGIAPNAAKPVPDGSTFRDAASLKPRVLVADDDQLNRTLAEMLLARAGCFVDLAGNGREALNLLGRSAYDLLLIDIQMPEMDGLEAIARIRELENGASRHLPIVALTGGDQPGERDQCLAVGADKHVAKPITPDALVTVLQQFVSPTLAQGGLGGAESMSNRQDPPHTLKECFKTLCKALELQDFSELESSASEMKTLSSKAGCPAVADCALRVQLAARSHDISNAASAVQRLRQAISEQPMAAGINCSST